MSWLIQASDPLYPDIEWNKPERKNQAGSLLIIGGNQNALKAPLEAYEVAVQQGAGEVKVVLPDALKKVLGDRAEITYAPSNKSGGLGKEALSTLTRLASTSNMILLPGDLGHNSETSQLLESLLEKSSTPATIAGDAIDSVISTPNLLSKDTITACFNTGQLQKFISKSNYPEPFTSNLTLAGFSQLLEGLSKQYPQTFIVMYLKNLWVAKAGQVSSTKRDDFIDDFIWQSSVSAVSSVYSMHNPDNCFQALTHSMYIKS